MGRERELQDADPDVDVRTLQEKKYMGAWDLGGKKQIATIRRVTQPAEITGAGNTKNYKPLIYIDEFHKPIVLNPTNMTTIGELYGFRVKDWIGKRIILYVGKTDYGKQKNIDCIRVMNQAPPASAAQRAPRPQHQAPALPEQTRVLDAEFDEEREAIEAEQ